MNRGPHILNALALGTAVSVAVDPAVYGALVDALVSGASVGPPVWAAMTALVGVTIPVVLGAMVPDIDAAVGQHRKTLHNGFVLVGFIWFPVAFGNLQYVWVGVLAHLVLDLLGSDRGIAIAYPLLVREVRSPLRWPAQGAMALVVTAAITLVEVWVLAVVHLRVVPVALLVQ
ncbi:MAG: metal-dependent hydrolase [Haloquadratum sp.]|jgi:hypothetical protein|nr:metal-dependent hydrolase [Haloferacaceae archaeon]MDR9444587.1 metal-dependent hydrolase [Haloquadratum sp.]